MRRPARHGVSYDEAAAASAAGTRPPSKVRLLTRSRSRPEAPLRAESRSLHQALPWEKPPCARDLGHGPTASVIGDNGDRFLVIARKHPFHCLHPIGLKCNAIADFELEHLHMRSHLIQESKALHDPVIEIDQF